MTLPADLDLSKAGRLSKADRASVDDVIALAGVPAGDVLRIVFVPVVKAFVHYQLRNADGDVRMTAEEWEPGVVEIAVSDGDVTEKTTRQIAAQSWDEVTLEPARPGVTISIVTEPELVKPSEPLALVAGVELPAEIGDALKLKE